MRGWIERCPCCGGERFVPYALEFEPGSLHTAQYRCARCDLLVNQPHATPAALAAFYTGEYYEQHWPPERIELDYWEAELQQLLRALPAEAAGPPLRVLEVGCGYGALSHLLQRAGHACHACDWSPRAVAHARARFGLERAVIGRHPGIPFRPAVFDLVIAWHVIEHVEQPRRFVEELVSCARPGGLIALGTENRHTSQHRLDRLRSRLAGRIPRLHTSPDHTYVFAAEHLRLLLREAGCGETSSRSYDLVPRRESLHWRVYKGCLRLVDRLLDSGRYLIAVGRAPDNRRSAG